MAFKTKCNNPSTSELCFCSCDTYIILSTFIFKYFKQAIQRLTFILVGVLCFVTFSFVFSRTLEDSIAARNTWVKVWAFSRRLSMVTYSLLRIFIEYFDDILKASINSSTVIFVNEAFMINRSDICENISCHTS